MAINALVRRSELIQVNGMKKDKGRQKKKKKKVNRSRKKKHVNQGSNREYYFGWNRMTDI